MPLTVDPAYQRDDASHRLRLIADTYGLTEQQRLEIIPLLAWCTQAMHTFPAQQAAPGTTSVSTGAPLPYSVCSVLRVTRVGVSCTVRFLLLSQ